VIPTRSPKAQLRTQGIRIRLRLRVAFKIGGDLGPGNRSVWRGVSKGVEDGRRPPALRAGHPRNGRKAASGVARPQGVEGSGMAGPGETLGSPWIHLAIRNG
jgi:hypothetical protein